MLGMDGRMVEHVLRNVAPLRVYRDTVEGLFGAMPGFGPGEFRAERGGFGRRLLTYAGGVKTTAQDPELARQRRWNSANRERGRAMSVAKRLESRGDYKSADRIRKRAERRIRKVMAEINR